MPQKLYQANARDSSVLLCVCWNNTQRHHKLILLIPLLDNTVVPTRWRHITELISGFPSRNLLRDLPGLPGWSRMMSCRTCSSLVDLKEAAERQFWNDSGTFSLGTAQNYGLYKGMLAF